MDSVDFDEEYQLIIIDYANSIIKALDERRLKLVVFYKIFNECKFYRLRFAERITKLVYEVALIN